MVLILKHFKDPGTLNNQDSMVPSIGGKPRGKPSCVALTGGPVDHHKQMLEKHN